MLGFGPKPRLRVEVHEVADNLVNFRGGGGSPVVHDLVHNDGERQQGRLGGRRSGALSRAHELGNLWTEIHNAMVFEGLGQGLVRVRLGFLAFLALALGTLFMVCNEGMRWRVCANSLECSRGQRRRRAKTGSHRERGLGAVQYWGDEFF